LKSYLKESQGIVFLDGLDAKATTFEASIAFVAAVALATVVK